MSENHEPAGVAMYQTIPRLTGDIASVRAEASRSFSQKNSLCEFFCEKDKNSTMLPQANRAFGSGTRPELAGPRNACKLQ
jgi:hypothetical protein